MPFLLRKIRKDRWYRVGGVSYLAENDTQADALDDLRTSSNQLSVWHVDDNKANLEQVIAALAANCQFISNVDYALLDYEVVRELGVRIEEAKGDSPNESANILWHREMMELSGLQLLALARAIFEKAQRARVSEKMIPQLIANGVMAGQIKRERLREKVAGAVQKVIVRNAG
jgi:hypothetical protein